MESRWNPVARRASAPDKDRVQAHFLLGPAGSGKTRRCVEEIRAALRAAPDGPPLIFVAPKQATFQLERDLLAAPALPGYTRLHILAFDRLAEFILESLGVPSPVLLAEEGRLMVLRALLAAHRDGLTVFRATARLAGFASQLSGLLREFQRHEVTVPSLARATRHPAADPALAGKLGDLGRLLQAYGDWLTAHGLHDADRLLDQATGSLRAPGSPLAWAGLWVDGFAEMTPQEVDLLAAVLPGCEHATLAFCLDAIPNRPAHWLSAWSPVSGSFQRLHARVAAQPDAHVTVELLGRGAAGTRFAGSTALQHLERHWSGPKPFDGDPAPSVRLVSCANPLEEVTFAARTIREFVREKGGRFRDVAVLVRSLDGYHEALRRVFRGQGIPFFLDRRESVAHHPLAELTRGALRTVAFGWQHADWFSALKTGLVHPDLAELDRLENEALARGWSGPAWLAPIALPAEPGLATGLEAIRARIVPPFARLGQRLAGHHPDGPSSLAPALPGLAWAPTGPDLANALTGLWADLGVEAELARWSRESPSAAAGQAPSLILVHQAVWEQMMAWLDNVRRAFPVERLPLREWLPILDAGLASLSVGVIPPSLDQVLVGAVDRSRNPDLRRVLLLGLNDGVFPAPPAAPQILTESEREQLRTFGIELSADQRQRLGRERYYGYIACTRPRERLVATWSRRDAADRPLAPSSFVTLLRQLFPGLRIETAREPEGPAEATHPGDVRIADLARLPADDPTAARLLRLSGWTTEEVHRAAHPANSTGLNLSPALARRLYGGGALRSSVSRLEQFAACPFKFLVSSGLRADERRRFEVDGRQRGSFQHEVLRRFHEETRAAGRQWRDETPAGARERVGRIAAQVAAEFGGGLLNADHAGLLTARGLTRSLQDFVEVLVGWMRRSYSPEPAAAELAFGEREGALPPWVLPLADGQRLELAGKVDRVDLAPAPVPGALWCVVHDYKSSAHKFDDLLFEHGIQLQLPAYLAAVCALGLSADPRDMASSPAVPPDGLPRPQLVPAGLFYASLGGAPGPGQTRGEVLAGEADVPAAYQQRGRFREDALSALDARPEGVPSGQFAYRLTKGGGTARTSRDPLPVPEFEALIARLATTLVDLGTRILRGEAGVDPYQKGANETACARCSYQTICRIDPWTHAYRRLRTRGLKPNS